MSRGVAYALSPTKLPLSGKTLSTPRGNTELRSLINERRGMNVSYLREFDVCKTLFIAWVPLLFQVKSKLQFFS